jgi:septum formation topological specificity factor MinE
VIRLSKLEKLREELYECIEKYGTLDERTLQKSQEADRELNALNYYQ